MDYGFANRVVAGPFADGIRNGLGLAQFGIAETCGGTLDRLVVVVGEWPGHEVQLPSW